MAFHHSQITNRTAIAVVEDIEMVLQIESFQMKVINGTFFAWPQGQFALDISTARTFMTISVDGDGLLDFARIAEGATAENDDVTRSFGSINGTRQSACSIESRYWLTVTYEDGCLCPCSSRESNNKEQES